MSREWSQRHTSVPLLSIYTLTTILFSIGSHQGTKSIFYSTDSSLQSREKQNKLRDETPHSDLKGAALNQYIDFVHSD